MFPLRRGNRRRGPPKIFLVNDDGDPLPTTSKAMPNAWPIVRFVLWVLSQGYTDYEGVGGRDGEEETGGASDRVQEKKKELLRVCGLCRMKGTILAMVDW